MPIKKILLTLGCAGLVSLFHVGCNGGLVGEVCQRACTCLTNCDHNAESICEDDADDVLSKVQTAGCEKLFDDLLNCELTCSCKAGELDVDKCKDKDAAVQDCITKHSGASN